MRYVLRSSTIALFFFTSIINALLIKPSSTEFKLWMLNNRNTSMKYERARFKEEASKLGMDFTVVHADEIELIVSGDDRKSIRYCNDIVSLPDVLLARTGSGTSFYNLSVIRQFERLNVPTLPNSASIEASKDKVSNYNFFR